MAGPYPQGLRDGVVATGKGGVSRRAAARLFNLGISAVIHWVRRDRETESSAAEPMVGNPRARLSAEPRAWLLDGEIMERVLAGHIGQAAGGLRDPPPISLRRIFESADIGLFHVSLAPGTRLPIGHDDLVTVVLCLAGEVVLVRNGEVLRVSVGGYAIIPEGKTSALGAADEATQLLLFVGLDQLPGDFFNSQRAASA